jgi:hypothetical protein
MRKHFQGSIFKKTILCCIFLTKPKAKVNKNIRLRATKIQPFLLLKAYNFCWLKSQVLWKICNITTFFTILSLGDVFLKSYWAGEPHNIYVRVVFSEKSGKMYTLPSTNFVAFWRVSQLCCLLIVYRVWVVERGNYSPVSVTSLFFPFSFNYFPPRKVTSGPHALSPWNGPTRFFFLHTTMQSWSVDRRGWTQTVPKLQWYTTSRLEAWRFQFRLQHHITIWQC